MDINTFKQKYKDVPLIKMIEYIDEDILNRIIITECSFFKFLQIKKLYNSEALKFDFIIGKIEEKDLRKILNNINNILLKEDNIGKDKQTHEIYITLLNIINIILTGQKYDSIRKITEFKDIPLTILTNEKVIELFDNNAKEIFTNISKVEYHWGCRYNKRSKYNDYGYTLYILRELCKKINFKFIGYCKRNSNGICERHYKIES
jgi:hypothetical protein